MDREIYNESRLIEVCLKRYGNNLAGIIIFGSHFTGNFIEEKSDFDSIILLKENKGLDLSREQDELREKLKEIRLSIHHFRTIEEYENHIYEKGSWSSWITVICGGKIIYSSNEFEDFRKRLIGRPIEKEKLTSYIKEKDEFELKEKKNGYELTKWIFLHIRRKLQILNYYSGNELEFDCEKCLNNLKAVRWQDRLNALLSSYLNRKELNKKETGIYFDIAGKLTKGVIKILR